jgi:transmembrane sensor
MRENNLLGRLAFVRAGATSVLASAFLVLAAVSCGNRGERGVSLGDGTRYVNETGKSQRVALPDGSHCLISTGTVIVLAKGFGKDNRDLDLDGEAMFEVNAGAGVDAGAGSGAGAGLGAAGSGVGRPFVVHTGNLRIEVLGTRFRVDAVRKRPGEEVDLLEGRLRVTKSYHSDTDNEPEVLSAGEMVMINREIDLMEKEKLSPDELDKVKEKF